MFYFNLEDSVTEPLTTLYTSILTTLLLPTEANHRRQERLLGMRLHSKQPPRSCLFSTSPSTTVQLTTTTHSAPPAHPSTNEPANPASAPTASSTTVVVPQLSYVTIILHYTLCEGVISAARKGHVESFGIRIFFRPFRAIANRRVKFE